MQALSFYILIFFIIGVPISSTYFKHINSSQSVYMQLYYFKINIGLCSYFFVCFKGHGGTISVSSDISLRVIKSAGLEGRYLYGIVAQMNDNEMLVLLQL